MILLVAHLALTAAYAGFQWTVRVLVHPQFARVPPPASAAYERSHQRLVTRVVGPLFAGQGVTTMLLLAVRPAAVPLLPVLAGAALLAAVLGITAFLAVPLHRRLDAGTATAAWALLAA
ncbi:DUF1772 domain-containing protein [Blastococcus goldschmidtiae]|uniref:DUF1772 domain-containing protein n=1 Tax=Blastococcus goldschmidtiae TaxID=3075546 RepID=A0ABU2KC57_9ACTN|nr:DUF1772 domain-containing protein [Blastococcus sp. DSM 46792]MDT0277773.1 DUF1772 domain-containing protein [Blastococcus sp. DSM 46792]